MFRLVCSVAVVVVCLGASVPRSFAEATVRSPALAQAQSPVTIYSFNSIANGFDPIGGLVEVAGSLYGTTSQGGTCTAGRSYGCGTIYRVGEATAPGRQVGYHKVLDFRGGSTDGSKPETGLVAIEAENKSVTLYGTTQLGGLSGNGTVFSCTLSGREHPIKNFPDPKFADGEQPYAPLFVSGSELYGTTLYGGTSGAGVAFEMRTDGSTYEILTNFSIKDGQWPKAGLLGLTIDGSSSLYGTTTAGGTVGGTVFKLGQGGNVTWYYPFAGYPDGLNPQSTLVYLNGFLYGTTANGGKYSYGSVFRMPMNGGKPTILHSFTSMDGGQPLAGLLYDSANGYLYGTTYHGNAVLWGTVFKIKPTGTNFSLLHYFYGPTAHDRTDGSFPQGNLILVNGLLYGTTTSGGTAGFGTVFAVKP